MNSIASGYSFLVKDNTVVVHMDNGDHFTFSEADLRESIQLLELSRTKFANHTSWLWLITLRREALEFLLANR